MIIFDLAHTLLHEQGNQLAVKINHIFDMLPKNLFCLERKHWRPIRFQNEWIRLPNYELNAALKGGLITLPFYDNEPAAFSFDKLLSFWLQADSIFHAIVVMQLGQHRIPAKLLINRLRDLVFDMASDPTVEGAATKVFLKLIEMHASDWQLSTEALIYYYTDWTVFFLNKRFGCYNNYK